MTDVPILETDRLILRPLELTDADQVQNLFPRWDIVKFLASQVPWPYPVDGALAYIHDTALPAVEQGKEWHWTIRPKEALHRLIGSISLLDKENHNRAFWLDSAWQGRGLMLEASNKVTDYWFETLGRDVLRVYKAVANTRSRRISERSGMRTIARDERDYVSGRLPSELWEITRDEWRAR